MANRRVRQPPRQNARCFYIATTLLIFIPPFHLHPLPLHPFPFVPPPLLSVSFSNLLPSFSSSPSHYLPFFHILYCLSLLPPHPLISYPFVFLPINSPSSLLLLLWQGFTRIWGDCTRVVGLLKATPDSELFIISPLRPESYITATWGSIVMTSTTCLGSLFHSPTYIFANHILPISFLNLNLPCLYSLLRVLT